MSRAGEGNAPGRVELADLVALNDEMAALVRAGVPLGRGLIGASGDLRGRLAGLASRVGGRLERGQGLAEALEAEGKAVPRLYRAVVETGLRAGRLPAALEGVASYMHAMADLRRTIGLALIYPLVLLAVAYGLMIGFLLAIAPRLIAAFEFLRLPGQTSIQWLGRAGEVSPYWVPVLPLLLVVLWFGWARSGRASALEAGRVGPGLAWVPGFRRVVADSRSSMFAELLALLIENGVPLPDALGLAASVGAVRDGRVGRLAEQLQAGGPIDPKLAPTPMLGWILATGRFQGDLPFALRQAGELYRQRAEDRADLIRAALPAALVVAIGGGGALVLGLTVFIPFTKLLEDLAF